MLTLDIYNGKDILRVASTKEDMVDCLTELEYKDHMELFVKQDNDIKYYVNRAEDYERLCRLYGVEPKIDKLAW